MTEEPSEITPIRTTFYGGITNSGYIEFYEYSRSSYALARLISTVEGFRRTGHVPDRITGASNVDIFTSIPEIGSWTFVNNLFQAMGDKAKLNIDFNAMFSWASGKSLDNMDLFNSNSDAIISQNDEVDVGLAETALKPRRRRAKRSESTNELGADAVTKRLTKASLAKTREKQQDQKLNRISLETDIAVAREARKSLDGSPFEDLEKAKRQVDDVEALARNSQIRLFDEESSLVAHLSDYANRSAPSGTMAATMAARMTYAANDLGPRLNRRLLGDRFVAEDIGADPDELDRLAAKARPLVKEIVLPLRKSTTDMSLALGDDNRRIIHIDEVRGRMISDSVLSRDLYEMNVFVIEYNRVTHSGRCTIANLKLDVPFSLKRQLINRLSNRAIDSLKEEKKVFSARPYLDDDGAIRSLLVEDIAS